MNKKPLKGWFKHADFIILDLICMQICFVLAYFLIREGSDPYSTFGYRYLAATFCFSQMATTLFTNSYSNIIKRGYFKELTSVLQYTTRVAVSSLILLFILHESATVSRLQFGWTLVLFVVVDYPCRLLNKERIRKLSLRTNKRKKKSLVVITTGGLVDDAIERLTESGVPVDYFISGIILMDRKTDVIQKQYDFPIIPLNVEAVKRIQKKWVDEVFILQPSTMLLDRDLMNSLNDMGITVHFTLALLNDDEWPPLRMSKLGSYKVFTNSINFISSSDAITKRMIDIAGGIIGCLFTGILFIFVAPAIYIKSPGPIFFKQKRIGINGKPFDMYKFRSMYLDAEERKAALMEQNKIEGGLMFKMDDDPRIIGSEKKDKNGKPKGIGNFIRNTSIDEFPQFFNVLKGDMSLVGNSLVLGVT